MNVKLLGFIVFLSSLIAFNSVFAADYYVDIENGGHLPPFTNGWDSASTNIQDAVDMASEGELFLYSKQQSPSQFDPFQSDHRGRSGICGLRGW